MVQLAMMCGAIRQGYLPQENLLKMNRSSSGLHRTAFHKTASETMTNQGKALIHYCPNMTKRVLRALVLFVVDVRWSFFGDYYKVNMGDIHTFCVKNADFIIISFNWKCFKPF